MHPLDMVTGKFLGTNITWKRIIEGMVDLFLVRSYIGSLTSILQKKAWEHNRSESNLHIETIKMSESKQID
jgi:hypothetical protein